MPVDRDDRVAAPQLRVVRHARIRAGRERQQLLEVARRQRQLLDRLFFDDAPDLRAFLLHERALGRHGDGLALQGRFDFEIKRRGLRHVHRDAFDQDLLEPLRRNLDLVATGRQERKGELAVFVCGRLPRERGVEIGGRDGSASDARAVCVRDRAR